MNDDIYAEWLIQRKDPPYRIPAYLLAGVLVLISLVLMMSVNSWFSLLLIAVILACVYLFRFLKIEYEYVFVTSELSVDAIYSQQIRKNQKKIEMSSVEYVEPTNEGKNKTLLEGGKITLLDYTSRIKGTPSYTMRFSAGGQQYLMLFEPNDKLLRAMWRCAPRKVEIPR